MFEILKNEISVGDTIKMLLTSGQEPIGTVVEIGENYVVIKKEDLSNIRIFEKIIGGWEKISSTSPKHNETKSEIQIKTELEEKEDLKIQDDNAIDTSTIKQEEVGNIEELKALGVKVVGKINLDNFPVKKFRNKTFEKTYRLSKVSRELEISIKTIIENLSALGENISSNPNTKISEDLFMKLKNLINEKIEDQTKEKDILGIKFNSLEQLKLLKKKINVDIEEQFIPANATIKRYGHKGFGYLIDDIGTDYYFSFNDVIDDELLNLLGDINQAEGFQVVCKLNSIRGRLFATDIILPKKVKSLITNSEFFIENKNFDKATHYLDLILLNFSDYDTAIELKKKLNFEKRKSEKELDKLKYSYNLAKTELKKKNFAEAKYFLEQAISINDSKSESALKELAYLLQREGDIDAAIEIVKNNFNKIKSSDPNSFIAYFYETKKDYSNALKYLLKVKPKSLNESIKLEKRKAIVYWGMDDFENAEKSILLVLKEQPHEEAFKKFYEGIKSAKNEGKLDEIETIFNEAELYSLSGGLSSLALFELERCDYYGVPSSEIAKESFTKRTLNELKKLIDALKDGRPKERAELYLSEAKVQRTINSEEEQSIKTSLAKYFTSISLSWSADNRNNDSFRCYILEACSLKPEFGVISPYIPMYLHSFFQSSFETKDKSSQPLRLLVEEVLKKDISEKFWTGLIDLFLVNNNAASKILSYLYSEKNRDKSLTFLSNYLSSDFSQSLSKDKFIEIWNKASDYRKRQKDLLNASFQSLLKSNTTESFVENFNTLSSNIPLWCNSLDRARINSILEISKTITEFNNQKAFEDKERYYNISINQVFQLRNEIEENPTEFSFNIIRNILYFLEKIINDEFSNLVLTSKPEINISILGEGILHEYDSTVNFQISLSNKKGSAPISWLKLEVVNTEYVEFIPVNNEYEQTFKGGEEKVIKLQLKVATKIKEEGATNIFVKCFYKIRGAEEIDNISDNLTLRLYSEKEFVKIHNPFAATADSGPVIDPSMFFGRDRFIENIKNSIQESASKCIIIYGQKRSGKSSVLYHLKERLVNENDAFCVSFSLGEIVENLSSLTFYYKVLSEMEDVLEDMKEIGINIPEFSAPTLVELKEAPSLVFIEYLKNFNKNISQIKDWENKKLILLLDEFTYIYTAIQKKVLSDDFMKTWKSFLEKGFFTSVLVGQDIMPKFTESYPNEFGVTEPKRLSYLEKEDAASLIEQPIWDSTKDRSRFLGNAVNYILDYTSSNPYYIQIFCARLVDYMNLKKYISVTEADIIDVAQSFIKGEQSLSADKFDNLITAGDADLEAFSPTDVLKALKEIAMASKNLDSCNRDAINIGNKEYEEKILKDLKTREVLSSPTPNFYKINVRLFKEWLLIN